MQKKTMIFLVSAALILVLAATAVVAPPPPGKGKGGGSGTPELCQKMFIPAYFYPGPLWDQAIAGAPIVEVMIMNPASGPGSSQDPNYVNAVNDAQAAGIKVIGYVHTSYGARDANIVKSEVDLYKLWYGVDGIFFDEVSTSASDLAYYTDLSDYTKATAGTYVALNPGTIPDEGYMSIGDAVNIFEGTDATYKNWDPPSWVDIHADKVVNLVHATSSNKKMKNAIKKSKERNSTRVYVTNDALPNPWDTLPSYWNQELSEINKDC